MSSVAPITHKVGSESTTELAEPVTVDRGPRRNMDVPDGPWFFTDYIQPAACEFIGCWIFIFIGTMSAFSSGGDLVDVALAHGFTIFLLIAGFGAISGGHFNPAVSLAAFLGGHLSWQRLIIHVVAQLCGGIVGSACTLGVLGEDRFASIDGGNTLVGKDFDAGQAFLFEWIATTALCMSVLHAACDSRSSGMLGPLAIGFTVGADIMAGGPISGASMNPSRSFGPAVIYSAAIGSDKLDTLWPNHWVYWVGPATGAFLTGLLYRLCFGAKDKRLILKRGGSDTQIWNEKDGAYDNTTF